MYANESMDGCITEEDSAPVTWDSVAEGLYDYLTT